MLTAALRGRQAAGDALFQADACEPAILERIQYHGVAGLLNDAGGVACFTATLAAAVRREAMAAAMWELRHRQLVADLLARLADESVSSILLKGTAVAYDLYPNPAARARGDTDVLIDHGDLDRARMTLKGAGWHRVAGDEPFALQEVWATRHDGAAHHVDLHWQLLNAPALASLFPVGECFANRRALPRLSPHAFALDRPMMLIHACIHRALHVTAPYFVDGRQYHGGDRLIWLYDLHLLGTALTADEWRRFHALSRVRGLSALCREGLAMARDRIGTAIPDGGPARSDREAATPAYLRARQFGRAWEDVKSVSGLKAKAAYFRSRTLPSAAFIRAKYPHLARLPLPLLYLRRMIGLLLPRRARTERR